MPEPPRLPACKDCGYDLFPRPTPLQVAEHNAYHVKAEHRATVVRHQVVSRQQWLEYAVALEQLDRLRQDERHSLRSRIVDLEIELEAYRWDLKVVNELVDDLKADLAAAEEGRRDG